MIDFEEMNRLLDKVKPETYAKNLLGVLSDAEKLEHLIRINRKELVRLAWIGKRTEDISKLNPLHPHFVNISNVAKQIIRQSSKE